MRKADAVHTWISGGSRFTRSRLQMIATALQSSRCTAQEVVGDSFRTSWRIWGWCLKYFRLETGYEGNSILASSPPCSSDLWLKPLAICCDSAIVNCGGILGEEKAHCKTSSVFDRPVDRECFPCMILPGYEHRYRHNDICA